MKILSILYAEAEKLMLEDNTNFYSWSSSLDCLDTKIIYKWHKHKSGYFYKKIVYAIYDNGLEIRFTHNFSSIFPDEIQE